MPLSWAERIVQVVLRGNPSAFACASSETIPAVISAFTNLADLGRLSDLQIGKRMVWNVTSR